MQDIQEIFHRIHETKKEQRKIKGSWKDALAGSKPLQDVIEELRVLKDKKIQMEATIKADFENDLAALERMALSIKTDIEMLSDMALTKLMKGESIELKDQNDVPYDPIFHVKFRKSGNAGTADAYPSA